MDTQILFGVGEGNGGEILTANVANGRELFFTEGNEDQKEKDLTTKYTNHTKADPKDFYFCVFRVFRCVRINRTYLFI
jgi:hypothetical protein